MPPFLRAVSRRASFSGEPDPATRRRGFEDSRTREVRFDKLGVTRGMPTDPLLALPLSEVLDPAGLGFVLPRGLLSWAFTSPRTDEPPVSTLALQSFKEPADWPLSFESCRPP
jgi:hypothetical protein